MLRNNLKFYKYSLVNLQAKRYMTGGSTRDYDATASVVARSVKKVSFSPDTVIRKLIRTKVVSLVETYVPAELRNLFISEPIDNINFYHSTGWNPEVGCRSLYPNLQVGPAWPTIELQTFFKTPQVNSVRVLLDGVEYHSVTQSYSNNHYMYERLLRDLYPDFLLIRSFNGNRSLPPIERYKMDVSVLLDGRENSTYLNCARLNQDYDTIWIWHVLGFYPQLLSPEAAEDRRLHVNLEEANVLHGLSSPPGLGFPNIAYDVIYSNLGVLFPSFSILSKLISFTIAIYRYIHWAVYQLTLCFSFFFYFFIVIKYFFLKYFQRKINIKKYIFYIRLKILHEFYKIFK